MAEELFEFDFVTCCSFQQAEELYRVVTQLCYSAGIVLAGGFYSLEELVSETEVRPED